MEDSPPPLLPSPFSFFDRSFSFFILPSLRAKVFFLFLYQATDFFFEVQKARRSLLFFFSACERLLFLFFHLPLCASKRRIFSIFSGVEKVTFEGRRLQFPVVPE